MTVHACTTCDMPCSHLQRLPEHAADALLEKLLAQGRIERSLQLELFRHSVTCVRIVGGQQGGAYAAAAARLVDASFMAYVSEFRCGNE